MPNFSFNSKTAKGFIGQDLAKDYLQKKGYKILFENYRTRFSEIDLVCEKKNILIFVEVKTRYSSEFGEPEEAVTPYKIRQIGQAILFFKSQFPKTPEALQIDVIAIKLSPENDVLSLKHFESVTS